MWVQGLIVIGIYMAVVLMIGYWAWRKGVTSLHDFAIAEGSLGIFVLTLTVAATIQSAFVYMGYAGWLYSDGIGAMLDTFSVLSSAVVFWYVGRRLWVLNRRFGYLSLAEFTSNFYQNRYIGDIVLFLSVFFTLPYVGLQLAGAGYVFDVLTEGKIPFAIGALVLLLVIIVYTYLGGIRAVAWTDAFQGVFMFVMFMVGGWWIIKNAFGSIGEAFRQGYLANPALFTLPGPSGSLTMPSYFSGWVVFILGLVFAPHVIIRTLTGKSLDTLKWSSILAGVYMAVMVILVPAYAFGAHAIFPDLAQPDRVFPMLLLKYTSILFASTVLAGALAAMMSTADSQCHAVSTLLAVDFYRKYVKKDASEEELYRITKYSVLIVGVLSYIILLWQPPFLVKLLFMSYGGIALIGPVVIGALYWSRASSTGALTGLIVGLITTALFQYFIPAPLGLRPGFIGVVAESICFVVVSLLTKPVPEEVVRSHQKEINEIIGSRI